MNLSNSKLETVEDLRKPGAIRQKCDRRGGEGRGERGRDGLPRPYALCPMPHALCPMPHSRHL